MQILPFAVNPWGRPRFFEPKFYILQDVPWVYPCRFDNTLLALESAIAGVYPAKCWTVV